MQLDAYRKKKAAKKEKKDVSSISGLNFAKNEDHQNALGERVASKPPFLVADGDEPKSDDSMKMTFTTTPTTCRTLFPSFWRGRRIKMKNNGSRVLRGEF